MICRKILILNLEAKMKCMKWIDFFDGVKFVLQMNFELGSTFLKTV